MQLITSILELLKAIFVPLGAYLLGTKTKENEKLKDENEKLKKYDSIENGEHSANDAYNARLWK